MEYCIMRDCSAGSELVDQPVATNAIMRSDRKSWCIDVCLEARVCSNDFVTFLLLSTLLLYLTGNI